MTLIRHLIILIFFVSLTQSSFAQKSSCDNICCVHYLIGSDPNHPLVQSYIKRHGGSNYAESKNRGRFIYSTSQINFDKSGPVAAQDKRLLIGYIVIHNRDQIDSILTSLGLSKYYCALRKIDRKRFPKVKKVVYSGEIKVDLNPGYERHNFNDCYSAEAIYAEEGDHYVANQIRYRSTSYSEMAHVYNPVGWHTEDPEFTKAKEDRDCRSSDCAACLKGTMNMYQKGITRQGIGYPAKHYSTTFKVEEMDIPLPFGLNKNVSIEELKRMFPPNYPWYIPENGFSVRTKVASGSDASNGIIQFLYENDKLFEIKAVNMECDSNNQPVVTGYLKRIRSGCETDNSPGIVEYDGFTYGGERKNGLPHGYGALYYPSHLNTTVNFITFSNYFYNGRAVESRTFMNNIYLGDSTQDKVWLLVNKGMYYGEVAHGKPEGYGMLLYAYHKELAYYRGDFKNGMPQSDSGSFEYNDGHFYYGQVKNGMRHGKGYILDENKKVQRIALFKNDEEIENPNKPNTPDPKPVVNKFRYRGNGDYHVYLNKMHSSLFQPIQESEYFVKSGERFYAWTRNCSSIGSVSHNSHIVKMERCVNQNSIDYLRLEAGTANILMDAWSAIAETLSRVDCDGDEVSNLKKSYETYYYYYSRTSDVADAVMAQLRVPAVQQDYKLAVQIFDQGIITMRDSYTAVQKYYDEFLTDLNSLINALEKGECQYY